MSDANPFTAFPKAKKMPSQTNRSSRLAGTIATGVGQKRRNAALTGRERTCGGFILLKGVGQALVDLNLPLIFTVKPLVSCTFEYDLDPSRPDKKFPTLPYELDADTSMRNMFATNEFPNGRFIICGFRGRYNPDFNNMLWDGVRLGLSFESSYFGAQAYVHWSATGLALADPSGKNSLSKATTDDSI